jgi:ribosome biogenesis GTPase / thiamine phosphate phosphatase
LDKFDLGWNPALDHYLGKFPEARLVRVTEKHKTAYRAVTTCGDYLRCYLPGKLLYGSLSAELPAVGDWCVVGETYADEANDLAATITEMLPRCSKLSRMSAGTDSAEQILAANIDFVFIVTSLNKDFSVNRLRRYVFLARSGNAQPVIVLSKADLAERCEIDSIAEDLHTAFPDVPSAFVSAHSGIGVEQVRALLSPGQTAVFVGSSGVGKSTLVNKLLERDLQKTSEVREADDKGRHTTSGSGLFFVEEGGMIIDTPGLREVQVLGDADELDALMPSVAELSGACRFADCSHKHEPGCAVREALDNGVLPRSDFQTYERMEREVAFARRKLDEQLAAAERKKWKRIAMDNRRRRQAR